MLEGLALTRLWNIFQNDLFFSMNKCKPPMYAEDHFLYATGYRINEVDAVLNNQAPVAANFYSNNFLLPNKDTR